MHVKRSDRPWRYSGGRQRRKQARHSAWIHVYLIHTARHLVADVLPPMPPSQ
jgi:hypothetical protein